MPKSSSTLWAHVCLLSIAPRPFEASSRLIDGSFARSRMALLASSPFLATIKSFPGEKRRSLSSHGAERSGIPQASASNTLIVGMPGSDSAYGLLGTWIVNLCLA